MIVKNNTKIDVFRTVIQTWQELIKDPAREYISMDDVRKAINNELGYEFLTREDMERIFVEIVKAYKQRGLVK